MAYFAVVLERGAAWDWTLPMRKQVDWDNHAAFMDGLADEGFVLAGGPLGGEDDAPRILHVVDAPSNSEIVARLAEDPWHRSGQLRIVSIDPWTILLGSIVR